jgi:rhodanese-related sulfurtransferase
LAAPKPAQILTKNYGDMENMTTLSQDLAKFLGSMPKGYYTLMTVDVLKQLTVDEQPLLVDVRSPMEYRTAHIKNAINLPLETLTQSLDRIPKNRPVVLYCSSGYRTGMAVMTLQLLGYDNVRGFPPSLKAWEAAEEPIED